MPRGSRDGQKPPDDNGQCRPPQKERRKHPRRPCNLPVRIVVAEPPDSDTGSHLFRVYTGWQCDISPVGVGFVTEVRLQSEEVFLELRSPNHGIKFQAARVVHAQKVQDGNWRYGASFIEPECRVDRYEFD